MIGLPTESYEDLEGIVTLCERIFKGIRSKRARKKLVVSLSTFVPKPHTPFQWASQLSLMETKARLDFIRRKLRRRGIQVKWQDPRLSMLEGAFARGDRRLARVLMKAHELGCSFDGWSDQFHFDRWEEAFGDCGISLQEYVTRPRSLDERFPWAHIEIGVSREFLLKEYQKAVEGLRTQDCRQGQCQSCGVCDHDRISIVLADASAEVPPFPGMGTFRGPYHRSRGREIRRKFRVQYTKQGSARFLSHLELQDAFIRAMRRGNIPLQFSEGFHPMPRIDLGPALPVGVESMEEYFDFESFGHLDSPEIIRVMKQTFPEGVEPVACEEIPLEAPSLFSIPNRSHYRIEIPEGIGRIGKALQERIDHFSRAPSFMVRRFRKDKVLEVDIKNQVLGLKLDLPRTLHLEVYFGPEGSVRVMDIVGAILDMDTNQVRTLRIVKTSVEFLLSPVKTALCETAP
jgi:radical SAM-linked protein